MRTFAGLTAVASGETVRATAFFGLITEKKPDESLLSWP
jgi:hypothetical protein